MTVRSFKPLLVAFALALIAPLAIFTASSAQADETPLIAPAPSDSATASDDKYVFWAFFEGATDGSWTVSNKGSASVTPAQGTFVGFRWGVGEGEAPRYNEPFNGVCGGTTAGSGQKLVALVIDPGNPDGSGVTSKCVAADQNANATQVLQAGADVRLGDDNAMVCGINGFPSTGCSYPVSQNPAGNESPAATVTQTDSQSSIVPTLIIIGIVIVLGALILVIVRGRMNKSNSSE